MRSKTSLPLFVSLGLFHSILLGCSLVHQLMEVVGLDQVQPLIQLTIQAITEPLHLLCIGVNVIPAVLAQDIELLGIVIHSVTSLLEGQQFCHLLIHQPLRNVVALEGLIELIPSDHMPLLHGLEMIPPH
jgi:hypothetical protein